MSEYLTVNYHLDGKTTRVSKTFQERDELLASGSWFGSPAEAEKALDEKIAQAKQDLADKEEKEQEAAVKAKSGKK